VANALAAEGFQIQRLPLTPERILRGTGALT
jgi:hypothetical protein